MIDLIIGYWWLGIILIAVYIYITSKALNKLHTRIMKPITDEDYLRKFCYCMGEIKGEPVSTFDVFKEEAGPNYRWVEQDHKKYIDSGCKWMPTYIKTFIDEHREEIKEAPVNPFTYFGKTGQ